MIIDDIKAKYLVARKARDDSGKALYSTLIGDIERLAKDDGNRNVTDNDCLKTVRKYIKEIKKTLGNPAVVGMLDINKTAEMLAETYLLGDFLPPMMDKNELSKIINEYILNDKLNNMGQIMKKLKDNFDGTFDPQDAVNIVKDILNKKE